MSLKASCVSQVLAEIFIVERVSEGNNYKHVIEATGVEFKTVNNSMTRFTTHIELPYGETLAEYKVSQSEALRYELAIMFIRGLVELESINILHGDIKLENAVIVKGKVKLIDFGIVTTISTNQREVYISTQTYANPAKSTDKLSDAFYALAISIILIFNDGIDNLHAIELRAREMTITNPRMQVLSEMLNGNHPTSFKNFLSIFTNPCDLTNGVKVTVFSSTDSIKLSYRPCGLNFIYNLACKHNISGFITTNACIRFSEFCGKIHITDPKQIAYLSLLLTLGLCGTICGSLEKEYLLVYDTESLTIVWNLLHFASPYAFNFNFNTLQLLAFCYSAHNHTLTPNDYILDKEANVLVVIRDFCEQLGIKLTSVLLTECNLVLSL